MGRGSFESYAVVTPLRATPNLETLNFSVGFAYQADGERDHMSKLLSRFCLPNEWRGGSYV